MSNNSVRTPNIEVPATDQLGDTPVLLAKAWVPDGHRLLVQARFDHEGDGLVAVMLGSLEGAVTPTSSGFQSLTCVARSASSREPIAILASATAPGVVVTDLDISFLP